MIVLDEEHGRWFLLEEEGRLYLDVLVGRTQSSVPGTRGSRSPYKARSLVMTPERERADEAVDEWQARKRA